MFLHIGLLGVLHHWIFSIFAIWQYFVKHIIYLSVYWTTDNTCFRILNKTQRSYHSDVMPATNTKQCCMRVARNFNSRPNPKRCNSNVILAVVRAEGNGVAEGGWAPGQKASSSRNSSTCWLQPAIHWTGVCSPTLNHAATGGRETVQYETITVDGVKLRSHTHTSRREAT